jgi:hypothetical protein
MISRQRRGEPLVVIHLDTERRFEWMDERSMGMIEVSEIGGIDRGTRKESRRQRRESLSWVFDQRRTGVSMSLDEISAKPSRFNNHIRSTFTVGKFSNSSSGGITVDLDSGHDKVANSKGDRRTRSVGTFTMDSTTLVSQ